MKYIIDIEDTPRDGLYKAKNFKTLVFDEFGLSRLEKVEEPQKEEPILVGDEVVTNSGAAVFVVTNTYGGIYGIDFEGKVYSYLHDDIDGRTGRRFKVLLEFEGGDAA